MAADKEIMKAIETLRLDRPGRTHEAFWGDVSTPEMLKTEGALSKALTELAATYREEAGLWAKSGARGWKSSEGEAYLIAQAIDDVAAQLDNAGGGAALSVSNPAAQAEEYHVDESFENSVIELREARELEAELRESAKRIDALPGTGASGLDRLIADSVAERKGMVRDELLPDGHPAAERKTAYDWNDDPRIDPVVVSWSDFGSSAYAIDSLFNRDSALTRAEFERARDSGAVTVRHRANCEHLPIGPGTRVEIGGDDVTAYLKGEIDDIPGSAPLTPNSITSAPEADDPFAARWCIACPSDSSERRLAAAGKAVCADCAGLPDDMLADAVKINQQFARPVPVPEGPYGALAAFADDAAAQRLAALPDFTATMTINGPADAIGVVPVTWESETMTADGHLLPGVARTAAPLLGQPGDAGTGYSHAYIPAGGRRFTYAELLTPVPAASLHPHLSHSQGNTIGDCATKYRLQRIEGLPQVPQWANVGGSAAHACFEAIERMMVDNPALSLDSIDVELVWKFWFSQEIEKVSATSPVPVSVWRASRKGAEGRQWWEVNGPLMLRCYLDARPDEGTLEAAVGTSPVTFIEADLTIDVPTPYGPLPFNAKIDRVTFSADGQTVTIRDYKTSYERPTDTTQIGDYSWVLRTAVGGLAPVKILGTYFDARRGTWTTPVDLLAEHPFEAFQYRVTTAYAQRLALTTGPTPARPSSYCGGCSVRYACPIMASKS